MKIEVYSPTIRRKEMDAVLTAMVEDKIGPGEKARHLIQVAKEYLHFDYSLALRSPALALHLALKALGLKLGQGVVVSALSPRYYSQVIEDMGLQPVYGDVSESLPCMNAATIECALKKTDISVGCIVLHHTLGFIPDAASIAELGLPLIEDISQSYGALPEGRVNGIFTILGLEERDMLTSGGGALLFAMNRRDGMTLRSFAELPAEYCLPDLNASMAQVQFKEAARNIEKRKEIARIYSQSSLRTKHKRFIPLEEDGYNNYAFPLVLESGLKDVQAYARKKEIIIESAFEQNTTGASNYSGQCPVSYSLSLRTVVFPLYPRLRSHEADRVSKLIMTLP